MKISIQVGSSTQPYYAAGWESHVARSEACAPTGEKTEIISQKIIAVLGSIGAKHSVRAPSFLQTQIFPNA